MNTAEEPIPFFPWLRDRVGGLFGALRGRRPAAKAGAWRDRLFGGERQSFTDADPVDLIDAYAASPTLYSAVNARANGVAEAPLEAHWAGEGASPFAGMEGTLAPAWHPLRALFPPDLLRVVETDLCLAGTALLVKLWNSEVVDGRPVLAGLQRVNPRRFTVDADDYGIQGFEVRSAEGQTTYLAPEQVVYVALHDPKDDAGGLSPAEVVLTHAGIERNKAEQQLSFFANDATPKTLFLPPVNFDPNDHETLAVYDEAARKLVRALRENFRGVRNAHRVGALPEPWQVVQLQSTPDGVAMKPLTDEIKEAICVVYGIPVSHLFSGISHYAEKKSDRLIFYDNTIKPQCRFIAGQLEAQAVHPHFGPEWSLAPNFAGFPQEDQGEHVATVNSQVAAGYLALDAAQTATGLDVDEALRGYYMIQGVPVHASRISELYQTILPGAEAAGPLALPFAAQNGAALPAPTTSIPNFTQKAIAAAECWLGVEFGALPELVALREQLENAGFDAALEGVAWTDPETYHLTLFFAEGVPPSVVETARHRLAQEFSRWETFPLELTAFDAWDTEQGRCLVALAEPSHVLVGLQATIHAVFLDYDLAGVSSFSSPHAYVPHITFGYGLPPDASPPALPEPAILEVEGVTLAFGEQSTTWRFLRRGYYDARFGQS